MFIFLKGTVCEMYRFVCFEPSNEDRKIVVVIDGNGVNKRITIDKVKSALQQNPTLIQGLELKGNGLHICGNKQPKEESGNSTALMVVDKKDLATKKQVQQLYAKMPDKLRIYKLEQEIGLLQKEVVTLKNAILWSHNKLMQDIPNRMEAIFSRIGLNIEEEIKSYIGNLDNILDEKLKGYFTALQNLTKNTSKGSVFTYKGFYNKEYYCNLIDYDFGEDDENIDRALNIIGSSGRNYYDIVKRTFVDNPEFQTDLDNFFVGQDNESLITEKNCISKWILVISGIFDNIKQGYDDNASMEGIEKELLAHREIGNLLLRSIAMVSVVVLGSVSSGLVAAGLSLVGSVKALSEMPSNETLRTNYNAAVDYVSMKGVSKVVKKGLEVANKAEGYEFTLLFKDNIDYKYSPKNINYETIDGRNIDTAIIPYMSIDSGNLADLLDIGSFDKSTRNLCNLLEADIQNFYEAYILSTVKDSKLHMQKEKYIEDFEMRMSHSALSRLKNLYKENYALLRWCVTNVSSYLRFYDAKLSSKKEEITDANPAFRKVLLLQVITAYFSSKYCMRLGREDKAESLGAFYRGIFFGLVEQGLNQEIAYSIANELYFYEMEGVQQGFPVC